MVEMSTTLLRDHMNRGFEANFCMSSTTPFLNLKTDHWKSHIARLSHTSSLTLIHIAHLLSVPALKATLELSLALR
jgi:hypothetical protein